MVQLGPVQTFWNRKEFSKVFGYERVNIISAEVSYNGDKKEGKIDVYVSNDGTESSCAGCTWELVTEEELNGTPHTFITTGQYLYWRVDLWGNNDNNPEVTKLKVKIIYASS